MAAQLAIFRSTILTIYIKKEMDVTKIEQLDIAATENLNENSEQPLKVKNEGYSFDLTLDLKDPLKSELKPPSSQYNMTNVDPDNKENSSSEANHDSYIKFSSREMNSNENVIEIMDCLYQNFTFQK